MSVICVDINKLVRAINKDGWHNKLKDDIETKNVKLAIGAGKQKEEIERVLKVKMWIIELSRSGRVRSVALDVVERCLDEIEESLPSGCDACDDPHLLAICRISDARYIISDDMRIAKCRKNIRSIHSLKQFCNFRLIESEKMYKKHRQNIIK